MKGVYNMKYPIFSMKKKMVAMLLFILLNICKTLSDHIKYFYLLYKNVHKN